MYHLLAHLADPEQATGWGSEGRLKSLQQSHALRGFQAAVGADGPAHGGRVLHLVLDEEAGTDLGGFRG